MYRTYLCALTISAFSVGMARNTSSAKESTAMKETIFREYDIRGIVDQELFIPEVYDLGRAIAAYLIQHNPDFQTLAIGMDARTHSAAIRDELTRAFCDSGINVVFLGTCPTPALYFSLFTMPVDGGLMITASHNGPSYNGIKLCLGTTVIWGKELQHIKRMYQEKKAITADRMGTQTEHPILEPYLDYLTEQFTHLKNIPLSCVIDCGNGTGGTVIPQLVKTMGWNDVQLLYADVDGTFPNHEADPTIPKNMKDVKAVLETKPYAFGIGLDGDCDRMTPMTKSGTLVPGDQLLALFAQPIVEKHPGAAIVFDIKSSSGLLELLEKWSATPIMSPSGHSIIKDMMRSHDALLGGELSCHFFFKDHYFGYDDGIYAALRLIELLHTSGKTLDELLTVFPNKYSSREYRLYCPDEKKQKVIATLKKELASMHDVDVITIDGVRATFVDGWGIVRASNTQAALSMRFESDTEDSLTRIKELFAHLLSPFLDAKELNELSAKENR